MVRNGRKGKEESIGASLLTEKEELTGTGRVHGSPVTALLDTGASVSLIKTMIKRLVFLRFLFVIIVYILRARV